jgi:hypothetical protein
VVKCPRAHADLRFRNPDLALDDIPSSLRTTYEDAVRRGCGCAVVPRMVRVKADDNTLEAT